MSNELKQNTNYPNTSNLRTTRNRNPNTREREREDRPNYSFF